MCVMCGDAHHVLERHVAPNTFQVHTPLSTPSLSRSLSRSRSRSRSLSLSLALSLSLSLSRSPFLRSSSSSSRCACFRSEHDARRTWPRQTRPLSQRATLCGCCRAPRTGRCRPAPARYPSPSLDPLPAWPARCRSLLAASQCSGHARDEMSATPSGVGRSESVLFVCLALTQPVLSPSDLQCRLQT